MLWQVSFAPTFARASGRLTYETRASSTPEYRIGGLTVSQVYMGLFGRAHH
jgi:hypothetical protein